MADGINEHRDPEDRGSSLACTAPGCGYAMHQYRISGLDGAAHDAYWDSIWNSTHADQYDEHHAPDIAVSWELSACCSVCPDGIGDVEVCEDGEAICCQECLTHWSMDGTHGEREEIVPTAPEDDARDAAEAAQQ